jgi:hypothetical protein
MPDDFAAVYRQAGTAAAHVIAGPCRTVATAAFEIEVRVHRGTNTMAG